MADEKGKEVDLEIESGGKKKKMLIIIIAVVILLAGGGGAYFFLMGDDSANSTAQTAVDGAATAESTQAGAVENAKVGSALYVPMPRPFRFNVPGAARDRFVEIRVQLLVRGGDNEESVKMNIPLIESTLLNVFSQANADDLGTSVGKEALKQQSLTAVQLIMKELKGNDTVEQVLFTGFVMQ
ncbi:flagellar basal body-associated protein FliL [Colwellia sp. MSW7]|uniref:Flagellar protein FliL n=1 Tax=Colwellia maritima TaxID=2912588 RepID=A0ABS9X4C4_9GAMM|nr:flagellar basal body-associated protein FliL [Colwellia maritima]MCI2284607.1 flagellar basal body-associated protein FliL [Colwellia maritima]